MVMPIFDGNFGTQ